ncbi:MAG: low molecular weight protein tyrosine phosphatase family protein [Verrucomicrobiota bacterium]
MKKCLLFICSQNKLRSPTGEAIYAEHPTLEVDSAGLNHDAEVALCPEQIEWADVIFVMEKIHRSRLNKKFGNYLAGKKIVVLGIPDNYAYMDPELVQLIQSRCAGYLP